jgi:hypothetical protein
MEGMNWYKTTSHSRTEQPRNWSSISGRGRRFFSSPQRRDRPRGPPNLLSKAYPGLKCPGREADHSHSSVAEYNTWSYTSAPAHVFVAGCLITYFYLRGRAIAQAVSRRLPTAAARVRVQVRSCGICGGQSGSGADFLRVLRFLLPILIPQTAPHSSSSIIRGWYSRPISGRRTKWI